MEFSRPEYWSGYPFPSPGDLPKPGIEPRSPALWVDSLPAKRHVKSKNTGVGGLSLLRRVFQIQESNQGLLHCRQILYWVSYEESPAAAAAAAKSLQSCPTARPHRRQPTRLPCPWDSPGKNTGVAEESPNWVENIITPWSVFLTWLSSTTLSSFSWYSIYFAGSFSSSHTFNTGGLRAQSLVLLCSATLSVQPSFWNTKFM